MSDSRNVGREEGLVEGEAAQSPGYQAAQLPTPPPLISHMASLVRFREAGVFLVLLALIIFLRISTPYFLRLSNMLNVARQISEISIIAVGMTYLIITQEFDLSVGSVFGLSAIIIALLVHEYGVNMWLAFVVALVVAACVGFINGILTTKVKIPSFIVTLGMLGILRGAALILSGGWPISTFPESSFFDVLSGKLLGQVPTQVLWMLFLNLVAGIVLARSVYGYYVYATGDNRRTAMLSGINVERVKIINFMLTSVLAAVAGAVMLAHLGSATPLAGGGLELEVIAAVVIGGTNLFGGSGTILGSLLGATIMGVIRNGLVLLKVTPYWQQTVIGMVIIFAVGTDTLIARRRGGR